MGFPRELLDAARVLYQVEDETQGTLRRSISTAYYALFHLHIESGCQNWPERQRSKVARQFEHKRMKEVSATIARRYAKSGVPAEQDLCLVANTFAELQEKRHEADYDLGVTLSLFDVEETITFVEDAFVSWERIKNHSLAQDYLYSLLFKDRVS